MKSADCNTWKGGVRSFKNKFKLSMEISILLHVESTNYYYFTCTQHMHSCPGRKHDTLKLSHLPHLIAYSNTSKLWAHSLELLHENSAFKRDLACKMISDSLISNLGDGAAKDRQTPNPFTHATCTNDISNAAITAREI